MPKKRKKRGGGWSNRSKKETQPFSMGVAFRGPEETEALQRPEVVSSSISSQKELWETLMRAKNTGPPLEARHLTAHATLAKPVVLQKWQGHEASPEFIEVPLEPGTKVNVVMASRFGDVGITDDLELLNGYDLRIPCVEDDGEASEEVYLVDIVLRTPVLGTSNT